MNGRRTHVVSGWKEKADEHDKIRDIKGSVGITWARHHPAEDTKSNNSFQDFAASFCHKWNTQKKDILTHCRRELIHSVWKFLLNDDFVHAYKYGMVIKCADGIECRVYPRFFTYSADYPEK